MLDHCTLGHLATRQWKSPVKEALIDCRKQLSVSSSGLRDNISHDKCHELFIYHVNFVWKQNELSIVDNLVDFD